MLLFLVQDTDRPLYVIASCWADAIERWKITVAKENNIPLTDVDDPQGVSKIADNDELVVSDAVLREL